MRKRLIAVLWCLSAGPAMALTTDYTITFEGRWTADLPRPESAHFTRFVGATHQTQGLLLSVGQPASAQVESVAELGATLLMSLEVQNQITAGNANQLVLSNPVFLGPEAIDTFTITVNDQFPLLTLISMIAPSPDWFTGVHNLNLLNASGQFIPKFVIDLPNYDAGTEDGNGFTLNNPATSPQSVIRPIDEANPAGALFGVGSIARLSIIRVIPGDTDSDGDIDDSDLGNALASYTGPIGALGGRTQANGDADGDGDVDDSDLGTLLAGYSGPLLPSPSVPEPGSIVALALAGAGLIRRRASRA